MERHANPDQTRRLVLGNPVPYILASVTGLLPHVKSGKLKSPQVRARIESQAGRIATGGTVERAALVAADIKTLSKQVKDRNIRPE